MKREPTEAERKSRERIIELINNYCNGSQVEFANRVGIGKSSVSQYVKGTNFPSNKRSGEIASAFGVSPMWIMGLSDIKYDITLPDETVQLVVQGMKQLNEMGVERMKEYLKMLSMSEIYRKESGDNNVDPER